MKKEVAELKELIEKQKQEQFSVIITEKIKEVKTEEKKAEIKATLEAQAKNFAEVKDFKAIVDLMKFDTTVTVETGKSEEFSSKGKSDKELAKEFEDLMEDEKKFQEEKEKNSKVFQAMEEAFLNIK